MQGIYDIPTDRYEYFKLWWDLDMNGFAGIARTPDMKPGTALNIGGYGLGTVGDLDQFLDEISYLIPYQINVDAKTRQALLRDKADYS